MSAISALQLRSFMARHCLKGTNVISKTELAGIGLSASKLSRIISLKTNNSPTSPTTIKAIEAILEQPYGTILFPNNHVKDNYISLTATEYTAMAICDHNQLDDPTGYLIEHVNDLTRVSINKAEQVQLFGSLLEIYNADSSQSVPVQIKNGLLKFLIKKNLLYNTLDLSFSTNVDSETDQLRSLVNMGYSPAKTKKLAMQLICQSLFKLIITNDRP